MRLVYVMDPMCGWCYGFAPELTSFLANHPEAEVEWIMGGLAPDSTMPMPAELQQTIAQYWHQIEARSQAKFNHDFWQLNTPYRSTYPACRAVLSAEHIQQGNAPLMVKAIQTAYYQQAKNPALVDTLADCAAAIGLERQLFLQVLLSPEIEQRLQQHLTMSQQLQVQGFPALFFVEENQAYPLALGFCQTPDLEQQLTRVFEVRK
ncbi:DsbA family protein [Thalassotalea euphylliae]|uniref:DsbA family protein n=1 Tax=Thalassotalea euphylliae TaxID=1655234 RepID=A0A3E0TXY4_9GAMM|nr:DsbA family protein [Thalassotalea euphylliae]REL29339.1 DsbA family protein [Thalassotalea euphylliae]